MEIASCGPGPFRLFPASFHQIPLTQSDPTNRTAMSRRNRLLVVAVGMGLAGLLAVAGLLMPSPNGHGTHQQLGLPPCTFLMLFGWPRPTCGMTMLPAHLSRGQWHMAWAANAGGTLLGLLAAAAVPWLLGTAIGNLVGRFAARRRGRMDGGRSPRRDVGRLGLLTSGGWR